MVALTLAVIAIAVAIGSWLRPTNDETAPADSTRQFSDSEINTAKDAVCAAHGLVDRATRKAASQTSDDPNVRSLLSLNVRLGATVSADYLRAMVVRYPATPAELAEAINEVAIAFNNTTLLQVSDASEEELKQAYAKLDAADAKVIKQCQ